ncbi:acetate/propionate family kinase [Segniliparus rugosus]|uniref:Acetate kinase n=1 Tax=Segniliparus rugosus (strain ATCC BAA-974 / DSM 45345 / CCUG 50838 / CIP 108380 / JCM 13579 / CDC 945) TaxID=679197 RepID=E5XQD8_SEGRC|nr:acetate kinase [Segniliparus rugosus]EFV13421.1 acetate kinase [Segniliparus rugosus ATCC BAA-974]
MRVLVVNPGSSSVKLSVVENGEQLAEAALRGEAVGQARDRMLELADTWGPELVGVRFVHGGEQHEPAVYNERTRDRLAALTWLAPLHQPLSLQLADFAARRLAAPVVACFDTAFHAQMPEAAARYALPREWTAAFGLRRYGFHGLSCAHALRRAAELLGAQQEDLGLVCCHIGAGVSATAVEGGRGVDTSMGLTPLEGAVMATRSGSVDPGLLLRLLDTKAVDVREMGEVLERGSGLAGMTGTSGDIREVLALRTAGDPDATLAVDVYLHRLRREIAAQSAALRRLDAVVLTGGVAEHQPALMGELVGGLGALGLRADPELLRGSGDRTVSPPGASPRVLMLAAREELEIAREAEQAVPR